MINLLPPSQIKELGQDNKFRVVLILSVVVCAFILYVFLILLSIKIHIQGELGAQRNIFLLEEERLQNPEVNELRTNISRLNEIISTASSFYQQQSDIVSALEELADILPQGAYLTGITWQKTSSRMEISGFVSSRDTLFDFKNQLEQNQIFTDIYFPPDNWVKPKDINFHVMFNI